MAAFFVGEGAESLLVFLEGSLSAVILPAV